MKRVNEIIFILALIQLFSCAQQSSPTGGPKDTIPPILVQSFPPKGQTKVNPKEVTLIFSETIIINNPKEQILITPDVEKKFELEGKNKTATLKFETALQENTTYLINFRDAVQDITEKNPVDNLKLAFSTGLYIDSLKIDGTVYDLMKNKEVKDATVALYNSDTFNIFKHKPSYITKTNDKGQYIFEYLKNGKYYLYAFEDRNKNLITDSRNENFGFKTDQLLLDKNIQGMNLSLIKMDSRLQKISSNRPYNTYTTLTFAKGLQDYQLTSTEYDSIYSSYAGSRAAINIYNTFNLEDSLAIRIQAADSLNQTIDSTLYIKFIKRETTPEKFTVNISDLKLTAGKGELTGKGTFTKPIYSINQDSIFLRIDSVRQMKLTQQNLTINNKTREITLQASFDKNLFATKQEESPIKPSNKEQMELYFGKGSFISVEKDSSAIIRQKINPLKEEDLGTIKFQIQTTNKNFITELLTKDYKLVASKTNQLTPTFVDLVPGDYILRVTIDQDGNGKWSPGNFYTKKEPEPFVYYINEKRTNIVSLKANWDIGPLLIKF
jgi:uncharacterized protein (DUF2141 family)